MEDRQITGRFVGVAALAYLLIFAGLISKNGEPLALAAPLVIYLGAALFSPAPRLQMRAERTLSGDTLMQDSHVTVTVRITNDGPSLDEVRIEDTLPPKMILVEGKTSVLTSLPSGVTVEMSYIIRAPRGAYTFEAVTVSASDHLGVRRSAAQLAARGRLLFLPRIHSLRRVAIRPLRTHGHFGPIPSRQTGSGIDFYGLREYQMGDPRRWINWRASQRQNEKLFVNQFEQERIADVGIILDARQQSDVVLPNGDSLFEYSVRAAGSLSEALLSDGNRVGLLVYGFGLERTFPGYGKVQQERILHALGQARTGHNFALESLGYLPTRFFPTGSQVVMISPLGIDDISAFIRLRACGYEVMVISPDPVDFEARAMKAVGESAWQIARVERALLLRKLQRMGVRILDWPVERAFEPLVHATLSRVSTGWRLGIRGSL
jgi:uncharacterized protein (DUF58 family)